MGKISAQYQMYIAIGLIVLVTLAVVFLGILPLFQDAAAVDGEIETAETELVAAQALLARRQSAKSQSAANEVELMQIANRMPDSPQMPSVIIELQDIANLSGVDLQTVSPGEMAPGPATAEGVPAGYSFVPITVLIRGQWTEVIDFFQRAASLDRGVRTSSIALTYIPAAVGEEGAPSTPGYVEANATLEVYVMAAAATQTSPGAASTEATTTP